MPCARFSNLPDLTFHQSSAKDRFSSMAWSSPTHFARGGSHWTAWAINPLLWKCKRPHSPPLWSEIFLGDLFFSPSEFVFDYLPFRITQISGVFFIQTLILAQYFYCCFVFRHSLRYVVTPKRSKEIIEVLKANGKNVKFMFYPDAGHDSWTTILRQSGVIRIGS